MTKGIPYSILLVDDDEDDRMMIDDAFMKLGLAAEIKKFINGEALLKYLDKVEPDVFPSLVVLDNTLPGLDASEILFIMKKNEELKKIPVLIYTTSISESKKKKILDLGAEACIEKGSSMNEIVNIAKGFMQLADDNKKNDNTGKN